MSIETLKSALPDYAKDLKLNLSSLAAEPSLTEQQRAGTFVASALASRSPVVIEAIVAEFAPKLSPAALDAAKAAAAIMAMNNIYYRFVHLVSAADYKTLPAKLRMNVIGKPGRGQGRLRAVVARGFGDQRLRHVRRCARARTAQGRPRRRGDAGGGADRRRGPCRRGDARRRGGDVASRRRRLPPERRRVATRAGRRRIGTGSEMHEAAR